MSRAAEKQSKADHDREVALSTQYAGENKALYDKLFPTLSAEATNPQGFAPDDLAAMNTASQQSLGGSVAGVVGQGNLEAARTRNKGAFGVALDEASRNASRQLSQEALGTQEKNAYLREMNRQAGLSGLEGLHGQTGNMTLGQEGLATKSTSNMIDAGKSGWFQNMVALMNAGANVAKSIAGIPSIGGTPSGPPPQTVTMDQLNSGQY